MEAYGEGSLRAWWEGFGLCTLAGKGWKPEQEGVRKGCGRDGQDDWKGCVVKQPPWGRTYDVEWLLGDVRISLFASHLRMRSRDGGKQRQGQGVCLSRTLDGVY